MATIKGSHTPRSCPRQNISLKSNFRGVCSTINYLQRMAKYTQQDRRTIINWFPALRKDPNFEITSDCTPAYNCIGWALGMNDVWVGIYNPANYAWSWWPKEVRCDENKESLVELFLYFGFEISDNNLPEDGYDKVALYADLSWKTYIL